MTSSLDIAKYIVKFFQECEDPVTNLKLQKLLYYVQGWSLALHNKPAFTEPLEAWVHGPVQPSVYHFYKDYRWNPINNEVIVPEIGQNLKNHIDEVLAVYGGDSAYSLERRTHLEEPWIFARNGLPTDVESNAVITHQSMKDFFQKQANNG